MKVVALCCILLSLGCVPTDLGGAPNNIGQADASSEPIPDPPDCPAPSLEIGRCQIMPEAEPCTGSVDEAVFVPVAENGPIRVVVGPQGASMLVFSLRTEGLDPGDLENPASRDRPDVSLFLYREDGTRLGHYTGRPGFLPSKSAPTQQEALGVFFIIEDLVSPDEPMQAIAEVRDQNDAYRCGTLKFQADRR